MAAATDVDSVEELGRRFAEERYFADEGLLTAVHLALVLGRPLALEGEPGVGKTELAKVLAAVLGRELIRLQCYEGLDAGQALYEWDYPKQLLAVRVAEAEGREVGDLYDERFLLERPLLRTVRASEGAVLLIDEIDRSDSEFEAFLLEFLSDFQITIPEVGTLRASRPPVVVLTSNRTRELHDALKRRCLYHWIPFPDAERERAILQAQAPGLDEAAADALVEAIKRVRSAKLLKRPGIAETIDWAHGAQALAREGAPVAGGAAPLARAAAQGAGGRRARRRARPGLLTRCRPPSSPANGCTRFLRALEEAGAGVSPPKRADFLVLARRLAAGRRRRAVLARAGHARLRRPRRSPRSTRCSTRSSAAGTCCSRRSARAARGGGRDRRAAVVGRRRARAARAVARAAACTPARSTCTTPAASRRPPPTRATSCARCRDALAAVLPTIAARRSVRARRGRRLDLRRVLAAANRSGGEIVRLAWRRRPPRPRRVLLLIDVSGLAAPAQPGPAPLRAPRRPRRRPGRGVHVRHAAHARDARARHAGRRRRPRRALGLRARRRRRHAHRRRPAAVPRQRPLRLAGPRRARDRALRRARARRPDGDGRRRAAALAARPPARAGGPRSRAIPPTARSRAACRRSCPTSTRWAEPATSLPSWMRCAACRRRPPGRGGPRPEPGARPDATRPAERRHRHAVARRGPPRRRRHAGRRRRLLAARRRRERLHRRGRDDRGLRHGRLRRERGRAGGDGDARPRTCRRSSSRTGSPTSWPARSG